VKSSGGTKARAEKLARALAVVLMPATMPELERFRSMAREHLDESRRFEQAYRDQGGAAPTTLPSPDALLEKLAAGLSLSARMELLLRDSSQWHKITLENIQEIKDT